MKEQIEDIADILCQSKNHVCNGGDDCRCLKQATDLYNAGYRKQEWISVDERLPELEDDRNWGNHRPKSIRVLCVCQQRSGKTFVKEGYYELFSNQPCWRIPGSIDTVTHWMPLPEPPKMKGGAE